MTPQESTLDHLYAAERNERSTNRPSTENSQALSKSIDQLEGPGSMILDADALADMPVELKRILNSHAGINRLPPELLAAILLIVVTDYQRTFEVNRHLALVCKLWRDVIVGDPNFWTTLRSNEAHLAGLMIRKSKNLPTTILSIHSTEETAREFFGVVSTVINRCRWFRHSGLWQDEILQYLQRPTPLLTSLYLTYPMRCSLKLHPEGKPLRVLLLSRVNMPWNSSRLSGLVALRLVEIGDPIPSRLALSQTLLSSPQLEHIVFTSWAPNNRETDDEPHTGPLLLPNLKTLELRELPKAVTFFILNHIEAPACHTFFLDELGMPLPRKLTALARTIARRKPGVLVKYQRRGAACRIQSVPCTPLGIDVIGQYFGCSGLDVTAELGPTPDHHWSTIGSALHPSLEPLNEIRFAFEYPEDALVGPHQVTARTHVSPSTVTSSFPYVTHAKINRECYPLIPLLEHLSAPRQDEASGCLTWPWPRLTELHFHEYKPKPEELFAVARFIERRYRAFREPPTGVAREGVDLKTLAKVRIPRHGAELLKAQIASANLEDDLRNLLPEVIIY